MPCPFVFPSDGWLTDCSVCPEVTSATILSLLLRTGKSTSSESTDSDEVRVVQKPLRRGHEFFFHGYVHDVKFSFKKDSHLAFIKSKCFASQKKSTIYSQNLVLERQDDGKPLEVAWASCVGCPAGTDGGLCHHIFPLLEVLAYYSPRADGAVLPGPVSCTSQPCSWGPRQRKVEPQRVMETVIERSKMAGERKRQGFACSLHEARGEQMRISTSERVSSLCASLPADCRFHRVLRRRNSIPQMVPHTFGQTPKGSSLSHQLRKDPVFVPPAPPPAPAPVLVPQTANILKSSTAAVNFPCLPMAAHAPLLHLSKEEQPIPLEQAQEVERSTRGQRLNKEWKRYHSFTLTASNFKKVVVSKKWSDSLVTSLFTSSDLGYVAAIKHGQEHELDALVAYRAMMAETGCEVHVQECGLVLHTLYKFLGASPDGLVYDKSANQFGLLEIKCPHRPYMNGLSVQEACLLPDFCCQLVDGVARLKPTHAYYFQVQGQLAITKATWCDFVIWIGHSLNVERIVFDEEFWLHNMVNPLVSFFIARAEPYLKARHPPSSSPDDENSFPEMETIYPADFCQSRIGQKNGSNACTVIATLFVQEFLSDPSFMATAASQQEVMEDVMIAGNDLYDGLNSNKLLSLDEVLALQGITANLEGEVFFGPENLSSVSDLLAAAASSSGLHVSGGVCVLTPYSFAICCMSDKVVLADSHCHGAGGALLAVIPVDCFPTYFSFFWQKHYPGQGFNVQVGLNKRSHFSLLSL